MEVENIKYSILNGAWNLKNLSRTGTSENIMNEMKRIKLDSFSLSDATCSGNGKIVIR